MRSRRHIFVHGSTILALLALVSWPVVPLGAQPAGPTGTVRGTVKVARPAAPLPPLPVVTAQAQCGASVPNEALLVAPDGGLANAIVWIEGASVVAPRAAVEVALDQQGCRFMPHVATATVGDTLASTSRDAFLHNVHAVLGARTVFNVAIPIAGLVVKKPLRNAGRLAIQCDVHPWMSAHVHVFPHPYHAVSARDGAFQIPGVPAGRHIAKVWHERLGEVAAEVVVRGGTTRLAFTYQI